MPFVKSRTMFWLIVLIFIARYAYNKHKKQVEYMQNRLYWRHYVSTANVFLHLNETLQQYYCDNNKYPPSSDKFCEYYISSCKEDITPEHIGSLYMNDSPKSSVSTRRKFSKHLDGTGGWYYDVENTIIVPNYTKPLRYYFKGYNGPGANDIPAEWRVVPRKKSLPSETSTPSTLEIIPSDPEKDS